MKFIAENNINYWPTPPESHDINPIEMVWNELKYHLTKRVKPRTKDDLISGIKEFWRTLYYERCTKYVDHIHKVLPVIVEREGKASVH